MEYLLSDSILTEGPTYLTRSPGTINKKKTTESLPYNQPFCSQYKYVQLKSKCSNLETMNLIARGLQESNLEVYSQYVTNRDIHERCCGNIKAHACGCTQPHTHAQTCINTRELRQNQKCPVTYWSNPKGLGPRSWD